MPWIATNRGFNTVHIQSTKYFQVWSTIEGRDVNEKEGTYEVRWGHKMKTESTKEKKAERA